MNVNEKIRELRIKRNLTQKQLAEKADIAVITLQQYESGKRIPKTEQLVKIAHAFSLPVNYFLTDWESLLYNKKNQNADEQLDKWNELEKELDEYTQGNTVFNSWNRELDILKHFRKLNKDGEEKAIEQVEMLTKIPEYQKEHVALLSGIEAVKKKMESPDDDCIIEIEAKINDTKEE